MKKFHMKLDTENPTTEHNEVASFLEDRISWDKYTHTLYYCFQTGNKFCYQLCRNIDHKPIAQVLLSIP